MEIVIAIPLYLIALFLFCIGDILSDISKKDEVRAMREILFRGKDIEGNWHYGVPLVFTEDYVCITAPHTYNKKVEADTIGQYTGLCDKNGKKIFEGDIIKVKKTIVVVKYGDFEPKMFYDLLENHVLNQRPKEKAHGFFAEAENGEQMILINSQKYIEIIGNIHDNPELLKEDEGE